MTTIFVISGVSESPLMTWGEIESTPFRLDGSDSPYVERNHGPSFKVFKSLYFTSSSNIGIINVSLLNTTVMMLIL